MNKAIPLTALAALLAACSQGTTSSVATSNAAYAYSQKVQEEAVKDPTKTTCAPDAAADVEDCKIERDKDGKPTVKVRTKRGKKELHYPAKPEEHTKRNAAIKYGFEIFKAASEALKADAAAVVASADCKASYVLGTTTLTAPADLGSCKVEVKDGKVVVTVTDATGIEFVIPHFDGDLEKRFPQFYAHRVAEATFMYLQTATDVTLPYTADCKAGIKLGKDEIKLPEGVTGITECTVKGEEVVAAPVVEAAKADTKPALKPIKVTVTLTDANGTITVTAPHEQEEEHEHAPEAPATPSTN